MTVRNTIAYCVTAGKVLKSLPEGVKAYVRVFNVKLRCFVFRSVLHGIHRGVHFQS
jgi:hypothetical protein